MGRYGRSTSSISHLAKMLNCLAAFTILTGLAFVALPSFVMTNKNPGVTKKEMHAGRTPVDPKGQTLHLRYVKTDANSPVFDKSETRNVSLIRKIPERNENQDQEPVE